MKYQMSDRNVDRMSYRMSDPMSGRMSDRMSNSMSDPMLDPKLDLFVMFSEMLRQISTLLTNRSLPAKFQLISG